MHKQELIIMVGESGSGKSVLAKDMVASMKGQMIRLNRDDLRLSFHQGLGQSRDHENLVIDVQRSAVQSALRKGFSVVIDDTNLNEKTQLRWLALGKDFDVPTRIHRITSDLKTCLQRDMERAASGGSSVGGAVIHRQFLESGRITLGDAPIVIVDIDGTLAQNTVHRSPYDESKVLDDPIYPDIVGQVRKLHRSGWIILLVSGRHSTCGEDTIKWLRWHNIPYHHIFMRHGWDNRPDTVVKQEILNSLLKLVPKEQIKLVIDDRPSVLNMWFDNGLNIQPAREVKEPF